MRRPEKRALHDTCEDPRGAASTEKHGQTLHKETAKHEFLVKPRADRCINNSKSCKLEISLHLLKLAQIAAKPRLFRKINGDENNCREPNTNHKRAHPTRWPFQSDVGQPLAA